MILGRLSYLGALLLPLISAQLSGPVGPSTTTAQKRAKVCNVLEYGGQASKTSDVGPAINSAFQACKSGGTVYIPPGDYGMSTWATLAGGKAWALQVDGIIYRTGTTHGNMFMIKQSDDFEMYSSTSKGAIQGYGYEFHKNNEYGPRMLRMSDVSNFAVHDIALVDSPAYFVSLDTCSNGEVYNMIIRGGNRGGLDGIDVWGKNIWIHDVEVTNKDECVTIKSPASFITVENIYCNWSGGCAFGSLGSNTDIKHITYNNIYTSRSNQMLMIKANGGSGFVSECLFNNFIGRSNAYSLNINGAWENAPKGDGDGVVFKDLWFNAWRGTSQDGVERAPMIIQCTPGAPCTNIVITDFDMWTDTGKSVYYKCSNAHGSGGCLKGGEGPYTEDTKAIYSRSSHQAETMPDDLTEGLGITQEIPIPSIPSMFFPGTPAKKPLLGKGDGSNSQ